MADLKAKGAVALNDVQLKELIVGKTVHVRNTITGHRFEIVYAGQSPPWTGRRRTRLSWAI